ncbi:uncharacterized protein A1O9_02396 [Exophiala aquamarina CBS 119918]|uniref:Uncharacterized protein n=1 Tax=Exophiala aquamarina CBS 119918 TaxID=1182545 RepID=A0A072PL88_9EURO|nr:uncharacterized protein A1O9_02396 [Exophiala aquamarina CBS 119918]KEF60834.1 hypothetical protein A1O9_02396 [Exophiala aquamarina CBS 119918]
MDLSNSIPQSMEGPEDTLDDHTKTKPNRPRSVDVRPNSILGDFESVDKIVVYAFGAFDRYYICWQDKTGAYQQERHGLPKVLDDWLFPANGGTRDLSTLQVSLGHYDEFFAFDKFERIAHKNTEFRENANNMSQRCSSPDTSDSKALPEQRRKSHTFSYSDPGPESRTDFIRRRSTTPKGSRPRSIAIAGAFAMKSWHDRKQSQDNQLRRLETSGASPPRMSRQYQPAPARHYAYSDAGVQTDMVDNEDVVLAYSLHSLAAGQSVPDLRRAQRSNVSSISSFNSLLSDDSIATDLSTSSFSSTSSAFLRNPVCMGVMQQYFRESQYRLGDALTKAPVMGIGAH